MNCGDISLCFAVAASQSSLNWLTPREMRALEQITSEQHRRDWLAGRKAAKELLRRYFLSTGLALKAAQIEIANDEHGAPYLVSPSPAPLISIAHSAGHGFAGLCAHRSIGVDLQQIRPVRPTLKERVLAEHEHKQLASAKSKEAEREGILVFWALKEATIKAQRTRPAPAFREILVTLTTPGHAEISWRSQRFTAQWGRWRGFIWAWVSSC